MSEKKEFIKISELKNWQDNPREASKADMDNLRWGLKKYGMLTPLLILDDGTVIGGNHRLDVLREMGVKDAWVNVVHPKNKAEMIEIAMLDNQQTANWINDKLAELVNKYKDDIDIERIKIETKSQTLDEILREFSPDEIIEDEVPEVSDEPAISKLGEVYQLGRHRVMCGDSTKIEDVEKLMDGKKADMVFTDPPYGMKKENEGVLNDNLNYDDLLEFNKEWIPLSFMMLKDVGSWYCWGTDEPLMDIYSEIIKPYIKDNKATFRNLITWDKFFNQKPTAIEQQRSYVTYDEKCLFIMMGVQGFNTNADNYYEAWEPIRRYLCDEMDKCGGRSKWREALGNQMGSHYFTKSQWTLPTEENYKKLQEYGKGNAFKKDYNEIKKDYNEIKKDYYDTRAYFDNTHETYMTSVWHIKSDGENNDHATPKPIELCSRAIKSSSRDEEMVLDLFGGSGSTLIACEQLNRKCYMMELDEKYLDVVRKRWAKYVYPDRWEDEWQTLTPSSHL